MNFKNYKGAGMTAKQLLQKKIELGAFNTGRPVRDTVINNDDIINLKISLGTSNDVLEFVAHI